MWGNAFSLAALTKWASWTMSYTSLSGNFKIDTEALEVKPDLPSFFPQINWYINANIVLEISFGSCFYYLSILDNKDFIFWKHIFTFRKPTTHYLIFFKLCEKYKAK